MIQTLRVINTGAFAYLAGANGGGWFLAAACCWGVATILGHWADR